MSSVRHCVVALLTLSSLPALAAAARVPDQYAKNLAGSSQAQVCRAARVLARAQRDFGRGEAVVQASWAWAQGGASAAANTAGIVAVALARAAEACDTTTAVLRYAYARAHEHGKWQLLFDPDIEALAAAARLSGDTSLLQTAAAAFDRRYEGATGQEVTARWLHVRKGTPLVGFEAAAAIRAALAVGRVQRANELADAAVRAMPRWAEGQDKHGYLTLSRGAFLEALGLLDRTRYAAAAVDLMHHLVLTQGADGTWSGRNTQATAYAVRGLTAFGDEPAASTAERGRRWLRLTQLREGAWATFNDLLPEPFVGDVVHEVTAEALLAIASP